MAKNTHLELVVSLDMFEVTVDYIGHDAWVNAMGEALKIGREGGFFYRPNREKMEATFYPLHRINLVQIRVKLIKEPT